METDRLKLPELCLALHARYGSCPHYNRVRDALLSGAIPASRSETGRWSVAERDLPAVARHFRLDRKAAA
jgi:hypothetical protein